MRIMKSFTLEQNAIERLKESGLNGSKLVSKLLTDYFDSGESLSIEGIKLRIAELEKQITDCKVKIESFQKQLKIKEHQEQENPALKGVTFL